MAGVNTTSKANAANCCTCNPDDLLFDECSCGSIVYEPWIDNFTTLNDDDAAEAAEATKINGNGGATGNEGAGLNSLAHNTNISNDSQTHNAIQHSVIDNDSQVHKEFQQPVLSNDSQAQDELQQLVLSSITSIQEDMQKLRDDEWRRTQLANTAREVAAFGTSNFAEERTDLTNVMNASNDCSFPSLGLSMTGDMGFFDSLAQDSFSQAPKPFDSNTSTNSLLNDSSSGTMGGFDYFDFDNGFDELDFSAFTNKLDSPTFKSVDNLAVSHQMPVSTQSAAACSSANRATVGQSQNRVDLQGHGMQQLGPLKSPPRSATRPIDLSQMQNQLQYQEGDFESDRAMARSNVRTAHETANDLYGNRQQSQQSGQRISSPTMSVIPSIEHDPLSANQLGKQPVSQAQTGSLARSTPSKKRDRPTDIQVPAQVQKRARPAAPPRPAALDPIAEARGRTVTVLLKTKWADMTDTEKARMILPIVQGEHPLQFEKEELEYGLSYGAARQREALDKAMRLNDLAAQEAYADDHARAGGSSKKTAITIDDDADDMDEDDELAQLKARIAQLEAKKKAKIAEEKAQAARDKKAAAQRDKRARDKAAKAQAQAMKDAAEAKQRKEVEQQQLRQEQYQRNQVALQRSQAAALQVQQRLAQAQMGVQQRGQAAHLQEMQRRAEEQRRFQLFANQMGFEPAREYRP